uniref:C-type lectin domain-containing protein n=1 Tax=Poecilia latipinna TaxID=48699 RepID=A0A3B3VY11_9TELE
KTFLIFKDKITLNSDVFSLPADLMMSKISCPVGWSGFGNRCFRYFGLFRTWARAERHCLSLGAQLASVHSLLEHHQIQNLISESGGGDQETWIGASDAEEVSLHTVFVACQRSLREVNDS